MPPPTEDPLLVTLLSPSCVPENERSRTKTTAFTIHLLPDPSAPHTMRPYLIREGSASGTNASSQLCEITRVAPLLDEADALDATTHYESYIFPSDGVQSPPYVLQDGSLYVITPVDPLFWFLPTLVDTSTTSIRPPVWEPLSQLLQSFDPVLVSCLSASQWRHVCAELRLDTDEEPMVQCSVDQALSWLQRKQAALAAALQQQSASSLEQKKGAFLSGFTLAESSNGIDENAIPAVETKHPSQQTYESIQLMCQYLSPAWSERFLQHLSVDPVHIWPPQDRKRPKTLPVGGDVPEVGFNPLSYGNNNDGLSSAVIPPKSISAGAKRLMKATASRGLQSVSSFFKKTK